MQNYDGPDPGLKTGLLQILYALEDDNDAFTQQCPTPIASTDMPASEQVGDDAVEQVEEQRNVPEEMAAVVNDVFEAPVSSSEGEGKVDVEQEGKGADSTFVTTEGVVGEDASPLLAGAMLAADESKVDGVRDEGKEEVCETTSE
jgi:hypothetical protein